MRSAGSFAPPCESAASNRVARRLVPQRGELRVGGQTRLSIKPCEEVAAPPAEVVHGATHPVGVQGQARRVDLGLEQVRINVANEQLEPAVGGDHLPVTVDGQRPGGS